MVLVYAYLTTHRDGGSCYLRPYIERRGGIGASHRADQNLVSVATGSCAMALSGGITVNVLASVATPSQERQEADAKDGS